MEPAAPFGELPGGVRLEVDGRVYSKAALLQACYWFTDRAYLLVACPAEGRYEVLVRAKPGSPLAAESIAGELSNSLLDFELRQQVIRETGRIRELIFAKAFAEGGLLEDTPKGDYRDPVAIGVRSNSASGSAPPPEV